jgi:hypothetical protein
MTMLGMASTGRNSGKKTSGLAAVSGPGYAKVYGKTRRRHRRRGFARIVF